MWSFIDVSCNGGAAACEDRHHVTILNSISFGGNLIEIVLLEDFIYQSVHLTITNLTSC